MAGCATGTFEVAVDEADVEAGVGVGGVEGPIVRGRTNTSGSGTRPSPGTPFGAPLGPSEWKSPGSGDGNVSFRSETGGGGEDEEDKEDGAIERVAAIAAVSDGQHRLLFY